MRRSFTFLILVVLLGSNLNAQQNIGIGTGNPDPSAKLDIASNTQGFLLPRMTTVQRDSIAILCSCTPAEGLLIFNTTTKCYEGFANNGWFSVSCAGNSIGPDTVFLIPGTYTWIVPVNETSVCVVCVGGGAGSGYNGAGADGGNSSFGTYCYGYGGKSGNTAPGGSFVGDGGGNGGNGAVTGGGGGGAGGYSGNGGNGVAGLGSNTGNPGTGGGGGGGSQCYGGGCGGGGGVGLYGIGVNGAGGCACCTINNVEYMNNGGGGSPWNNTGTNGDSGSWGSFAVGGFPGGGASGVNSGGGGGLGYKNNITVTPGQQITVVVGEPGAAGTQCNCGEEPGAGGAVRIIWGTGRSFPNNAH